MTIDAGDRPLGDRGRTSPEVSGEAYRAGGEGVIPGAQGTETKGLAPSWSSSRSARTMAPMTPRRSPATPPAVVERAYDLFVWIDARVSSFPAQARPLLGARTHGAAGDVLDLVLRAAYEPRGSPALAAALRTCNQRVASLRYLLRACHAQRHLSGEQHAFAVAALDEVGRMAGAWLRATEAARG